MPTSVSSGTQTATISTEHTLVTDTTNKTYVLVVNTTNMVNGDTLELRLYTKPLSGSASTLAYYVTYANVQGDPVKYSIPVPADIELKATLKQTAGTGRAYEWKLLSL